MVDVGRNREHVIKGGYPATSIEQTRIRILCDDEPHEGGTYVVYWMQLSQRAAHNPALEHAVQLANGRDEPVVVGFGLYERYAEAHERSFALPLAHASRFLCTIINC